MDNVRLCVTPKLLLKVLLGCYGILFALHLLGILAEFPFGHDHVFGLVPMFYFGAEKNVPTAYTFLLFLFASGICSLVAKIDQTATSRWAFLGIVFFILGIDEFVSIHEKFNGPVRELLSTSTGFFSTSGFFYYAWMIPYLAIVIGLFLFLIEWLRNLPQTLRNGMITSAFIYLSGVILMEGMAGWYSSNFMEGRDLIYLFFVSLEESFEILGLTTFIYVVSKYLASTSVIVQIQFADKQ